jgi:hypothetical protein
VSVGLLGITKIFVEGFHKREVVGYQPSALRLTFRRQTLSVGAIFFASGYPLL